MQKVIELLAVGSWQSAVCGLQTTSFHLHICIFAHLIGTLVPIAIGIDKLINLKLCRLSEKNF